MKSFGLLLIVVGLLVPAFLLAQVPTTISYQGRLDSSGVPIKSPKNLTFALYGAATGGTALWTETQSSVPFTGGMFSVKLGSVTPIPVTLFNTAGERWLGVTIAGGTEMTPRFQFTSSPFALRALDADDVADNAVTAAKIADGAITSAKIADGTISPFDLGDLSVRTAKLADNSVTAAKTFDEAGVAQAKGDPNQLVPLTTTGKALVGVTLTAPAAGFAIVHAACDVFVVHANGAWDNIICKVSTASGDVGTPSTTVALVRVPAEWPTGSMQLVVPLSIMYAFPVAAGSTTFYLNGLESTGTGNDSILDPVITAMFVPTAYTTVASPSVGPEGGKTGGIDLNLGK